MNENEWVNSDKKKGRELLWRVHFDVTLSVNVFTSVHNYTPTKICCTVIIEVHYSIEYEDILCSPWLRTPLQMTVPSNRAINKGRFETQSVCLVTTMCKSAKLSFWVVPCGPIGFRWDGKLHLHWTCFYRLQCKIYIYIFVFYNYYSMFNNTFPVFLL